MLTALSPERLASFSVRRPWLVVATWVVILVAAGMAASRVGEVLTTSAVNYVDTDSITANELVEERLYGRLPGQELVVIQSASQTIDDPEFAALVKEITEKFRANTASVANVVNAFEAPPEAGLISDDRRTTILPVTLTGDRLEADKLAEPLLELTEEFDGQGGFTVVMAGDGSSALAFTHQAEKDLQSAELLGIPVAIVILMLVFGALVAAGMPIILGMLAIGIAIGVSAIIGTWFELSVFLVNFVTTMGLAVGIDYSLLIVQRVREERRNGLSVDAAILRAGATASRAVLFSGMTVVVALCGLVLVPNSIFRSLGVGAILVVAIAVILALTLLPAVLKLLGDRINAVRIRIPGLSRSNAGGRGFWDRAVGVVMRHPVISVVFSVGLLVAASLPYVTIHLGWAGVSTLPESTSARRAFEILDQEFSAGLVSPARVVIDAPDVDDPAITGAVASLQDRVHDDPRFLPGEIERGQAGNLLSVSFSLLGDPQSDEARDAITTLRNEYIPAAFNGTPGRVLVTGATAEGMDNTQIISDYTLPVFVFVLGLSFVILLVVFRSIVVPVKAMIMNLLSVGAAYGLMVLIFQHGVGNELLGFSQVERIEAWVPLFMFATVFGLSMDYHVFLLTRIRERFDHTGNNAESVAYGVRTTAGMITGAAAIMVAVFAGFASGEMVMFQQMGFGLAAAVILDATIVRTVLVPASMELLGARNWYLPAWLQWLPRVDVEGSNVPAPAPVPGAIPAGAESFAGE